MIHNQVSFLGYQGGHETVQLSTDY